MNLIPAILLTAGKSERMGTCKQLLPFQGKPLLAHLLDTLTSVPEISPIVVVTGHFKEELAPLLGEYNAIAVPNPDYAEGGMLSSIQAGVRALPAGCSGFLLLLGDQPFVTSEVLNALIAASQAHNAPIFQPSYEGRRGHPVLFRASCIPEILALPTTATLKTLTTRHSNTIQTVPLSQPALLRDIDTPEEYQAALRLWQQQR